MVITRHISDIHQTVIKRVLHVRLYDADPLMTAPRLIKVTFVRSALIYPLGNIKVTDSDKLKRS